LGHEGIGRIVEFGENISSEKSDLKLGDLIGIQFLQGICHQCEFCLDGRETLCNSKVTSGCTKVSFFQCINGLIKY
jgi:propanol-preferring alcohol dehydrogenase